VALFVVGLPIGNIEDISLRAIKTLSEAELIVCEDTRNLSHLWAKLKSMDLVKTNLGRMVVLNDYNERDTVTKLVGQVLEFEKVVLVSDAGMPTFSDPGFRLIKELLSRGGSVKVIPGPSAAIGALAVSGLSSDRVLFLGFLPKKESKRKDLIRTVCGCFDIGITIVVYESALRIEKTLQEFGEMVSGDCQVVIVRELTKVHEEILRGTINRVTKEIAKTKLLGEIVMLFRVGE